MTWMAWLTVAVLALTLWRWFVSGAFPWLLVVFVLSALVSVIGGPPGDRWSVARSIYLRGPADR